MGGTGPDQEEEFHDPEAAETFAESVGADPTHEQIEQYLEIAGAPPLTEQADH